MGIVVELKNKFLMKNPDYTNDINNFVYYISIHEGEEVFDKEFIVGGMTTKYILQSLQFNIDYEKIKSKETAKKYLSSVGMLMDYILTNSNIKNISFMNELGAPARRKESYRCQCNDFVKNCNQLRDKEIYSAVEYDVADRLVSWCDLQIENATTDKMLFLRPATYRKMVAGICIKLMLFTGVTYRCVRQLKMESLDLEVNTIRINNYVIRLPIKFSKQLNQYKSIRLANHIHSDYLFVNEKGDEWGRKVTSSGIPDYLRQDGFEVQLTSIIKYGIKELINVGINEAIISEITGASSDIIRDCLPVSESEQGWYSYINSKIVNSRLYETL